MSRVPSVGFLGSGGCPSPPAVLGLVPPGLIFWGFLFDTMLLPPVYRGGESLTVDDDESVYFVLPSVRKLFAVWKRHLDSLCRGGLSVPWDSCVSSVDSVKSLGCRFRCSGITGFVPVARSALCDLSLQFHGSSCLRDLRTPFAN